MSNILLNSNSSGDVVGPSVAVDKNIMVADGTTGKKIKDGGKTIAEVLDRANHTGSPSSDVDMDTHAITGITSLKNSSDPRYYRNVARLTSSGSPDTGTLKIVMPKSWSNTMMQLTIRGYDYTSTTGAWELVIGGYNYTGTSAWIYTSARCIGSPPFTKARFGHDGTHCVILLGVTTTTWADEKVTISDFIAGFSNIDGWDGTWSMSFITSEAGITVTQTINNVHPSLGVNGTSPNEVNVLDYGADNTGTATAAVATTNSTAFTNAIAALNDGHANADGGVLIIPGGEYYLGSNSITFNRDYSSILAYGAHLTFTGTYGVILQGTSYRYLFNVSILGSMYIEMGSTAANSRGLWLINNKHAHIEGVTVNGGEVALELYGRDYGASHYSCFYNLIQNCTLYGKETVLFLNASSTSNYVNDNTFINNTLQFLTTQPTDSWGIWTDTTANNNVFINQSIECNPGTGGTTNRYGFVDHGKYNNFQTCRTEDHISGGGLSNDLAGTYARVTPGQWNATVGTSGGATNKVW